MSGRAYSRVYWGILDDPKFNEIRDSDARLALWLRLLLVADAMWPAPAALPPSADPDALRALIDVRLVDPLPGSRYRIHGLDAERLGRAASARVGALERWDRSISSRGGVEGSAVRNGQADVLQDRYTQQASERSERANGAVVTGVIEETTDRTRETEGMPSSQSDGLLAIYADLGPFHYIKQSTIRWLNSMKLEFGEAQTIDALRRCWAHSQNAGTLLQRTQTLLVKETTLTKNERDRRARAERMARTVAERDELERSFVPPPDGFTEAMRRNGCRVRVPSSNVQ